MHTASNTGYTCTPVYTKFIILSLSMKGMQKNRYSQDISIIINEKWNVVSVNYYHLLFDFIYIYTSCRERLTER